MTEELAKSFVIAVALHLLSLTVVACFGWSADYEIILGLAVGSTPDPRTIGILSDSAFNVVAYFSIAMVLSQLTGSASGKLVRKFGLDKRFEPLRAGDEWHYVLLGEYEQLKAGNLDSPPADVAVVAAVELDGAAQLYFGFLEEFYYDRTGTLDRIVLIATARRSLVRPAGDHADPGDDDDRGFHPIPGDYVVIPYKEIKNLNIRYVYAEQEEPGDAARQGEAEVGKGSSS